MVKKRNGCFIAWPYIEHVCALVWAKKQGWLLSAVWSHATLYWRFSFTLCDPETLTILCSDRIVILLVCLKSNFCNHLFLTTIWPPKSDANLLYFGVSKVTTNNPRQTWCWGSLFVVVLCHSNSISGILWRWYDAWWEVESLSLHFYQLKGPLTSHTI